jgi:hypothetical protein
MSWKTLKGIRAESGLWRKPDGRSRVIQALAADSDKHLLVLRGFGSATRPTA